MIFIKGVHVRPGYQRAAAGVVSVLLAGGAVGAIALHPKHSTAGPAVETPPATSNVDPGSRVMLRPEWIHEAESEYISLSTRIRYSSTVDATSPARQVISYAVEDGDTYWSIAAGCGSDTATLADLNPEIAPNELRPGQTLRIVQNFHGTSHAVQSGDTLSTLAATYGTTIEEIRLANGISDKAIIYANDHLLIPGAHTRPASVSRGDFVRTTAPASSSSAISTARAANGESGWIWPISDGIITTEFTGSHNGIDIAIAQGSKVLAAKGGTVVFAGWDGGYGYCVVLDHGDGYKSRYAHAATLLVRAGTVVSTGDPVILVGSTGHSTGPHLHFEITVRGTPRNPRNFLR